jgi:hypothetical protein
MRNLIEESIGRFNKQAAMGLLDRLRSLLLNTGFSTNLDVVSVITIFFIMFFFPFIKRFCADPYTQNPIRLTHCLDPLPVYGERKFTLPYYFSVLSRVKKGIVRACVPCVIDVLRRRSSASTTHSSPFVDLRYLSMQQPFPCSLLLLSHFPVHEG